MFSMIIQVYKDNYAESFNETAENPFLDRLINYLDEYKVGIIIRDPNAKSILEKFIKMARRAREEDLLIMISKKATI